MNEQTFGTYLQKLRKKRGHTLKELAELTGLSDAQISRIENGLRGAPKRANIKKLEIALDVPTDSLLEKAGLIKKVDSAFDDVAMLAGALDPKFYENDHEVRNYFQHELNKFADMEQDIFKEHVFQQLWLVAQNYGIPIRVDQFTPSKFIDGVIKLESRMRMLLVLELSNLESDWEREETVLNLEDVLNLPNIAYADKPLSQKDRKRIKSMLSLFFKEEE